MSNNLTYELKEFLKSGKLSNYEIKAYLAMLEFNDLTAKEISQKSRVPAGRIYEVLEELKIKGLIEIQESRPKKYRKIHPNKALYNLISHFADENRKRMTYLTNQAKNLESQLKNSKLFTKEDSSRIFWSTAFGWKSVFDLYLKKFSEMQEELLMTGFIDNNTIKILHFAKPFYLGIKRLIDRGISVKYLWCFDHDQRAISEDLKIKNETLYDKLMKRFKELYDFTPNPNLEVKFIHNRIPTYFDILDKRRIIIKLQDPLQPHRIFSALNVLDPNLARELRNKFFEIWLFVANEGNISL